VRETLVQHDPSGECGEHSLETEDDRRMSGQRIALRDHLDRASQPDREYSAVEQCGPGAQHRGGHQRLGGHGDRQRDQRAGRELHQREP